MHGADRSQSVQEDVGKGTSSAGGGSRGGMEDRSRELEQKRKGIA